MPDDAGDIAGDGGDPVLMKGGSVIISPLGVILAGPLRDAEGILHAEIDFGDIARSKLDFDPVGHYSRSDIFNLQVDETRRETVKVNS